MYKYIQFSYYILFAGSYFPLADDFCKEIFWHFDISSIVLGLIFIHIVVIENIAMKWLRIKKNELLNTENANKNLKTVNKKQNRPLIEFTWFEWGVHPGRFPGISLLSRPSEVSSILFHQAK